MCKLTELLNKFPESKNNSANTEISAPINLISKLSNTTSEAIKEYIPNISKVKEFELDIINLLRMNENQFGHTYLTLHQIKQQLKLIYNLNYKQSQLKSKLNKIIKADNSSLIKQDRRYYRINTFLSEVNIANNIKQRLLKEDSKINVEIEDFNFGGFEPSKEQVRAIEYALTKNIMVLTGGPGTGKTSIAKYIFHNLIKQNPDKIIKVMAPTGTAAQRISDVIGCNATTIHSAIGLLNNYSQTKYDNDYEADIVIVDESSMIDTNVAYNLFKALKIDTKLIFIGDINQTESICAGNFLSDMIMGGIPTIKLTKVFRQAEDNPIVDFAYKVNDGNISSYKKYIDEYNNNLCISIQNNDKKVQDELIKEIISQYHLSDNIYETQVLLSNNINDVGVDEINRIIQLSLNEKDFIHRINKYKQDKDGNDIIKYQSKYKMGDKIIQIVNNPIKDVYNGNIGEIISYDNEKITIEFKKLNTSIIVEYPLKSNILERNIRLAYAITIHKSQGQEYKNVIIGIDNQSRINRKLLYTAITRAKENLLIISTKSAIEQAIRYKNHTQNIKNKKVQIIRNSSLKYMLGYKEEIQIKSIVKIILYIEYTKNIAYSKIFTKYQDAYF